MKEQREVFFAYPHLVGAVPPEPVRVSFEERVAAVAAAGSSGLAMDTHELDELLTTHTPDRLRGVLGDHGVRIWEMDLLAGWHDASEEGRASEKAVFKYAEMFGSTHVKTAILLFPPAGLPPLDLLTERFAALCDRAADVGLTVALEPFALFPSFPFAVAADMVIAAGRLNGGLLFDSWHTFRDPTGPATLDRVSARHVTGVELADGHAVPRGDLGDDCINSRLLPGEGDFDLVRFMRTLDAKGVDLPLSAEVLSREMRQLAPRDNAERTVAAIRKLLAASAPGEI